MSLVPSYKTAGGWIAVPMFTEGAASTNRFKHEGCEELWFHDMTDGSVRGVIGAACATCKRSYADHRLIEPVWEKAGAPAPQISQPQGSGKYPGYAELSVLQVLDKLQDHDLLEIFYDDEVSWSSESVPNPNYGQPNNVNQHTMTIQTQRALVVKKAKFLVGKRVEGALASLRGTLKLAESAVQQHEVVLKLANAERAEAIKNLAQAQTALKERGERILEQAGVIKEAVEETLRLTKIIEASKNLRIKVPNFEKGMPIVVERKQEDSRYENQNPSL